MLLYSLFDLERPESEVCLHKQKAALLNYLYLADFILDELLCKHLLLLVGVNHINVTFVVCRIELLLCRVPAQVREDGIIRVVDLRLQFIIGG